MKKRSYEIDMTRGALAPQIVRFAVPLVLSGILQLLFNAADMIVVGQFAEQGSIGAVGSTGALINLFINLLMGLSVGACAVVARRIGAGDPAGASRAAHTAIVTAVVCGVVIGAFAVSTVDIALRWMETPADVIDRATLYARIFLAGTPINMLYNFGASIMRATGDTRRPLVYLTVAGVVNVLLNLVAVIGFGLGVAGVAIATVASQTISAFLVLRALFTTDGPCRLSMKKMKVDAASLKSILQIGIPAGLQSVLFAISNVLIQSSVNSFESIAMDGNSAAGNLEGFVYTSMNAIAQASLTFVSQNYGAANFKRVRRSLYTSLWIVSAIGIVLGFTLYAFHTPLLSIYLGKGSPSIAYGATRMSVIALTYFLDGLMDVFASALRGIGHSVTPMIMTFLGSCAFRIVWIFTVFRSVHTLKCLYTSYPCSWILTTCAEAIAFFIILRKMERAHKTAASAAS